MEKRIRPFTTILLILLAVVISSGATYLFVTDQANKENDNLQSQIDTLNDAINAQKSSTTATTDETADWKTYTNTTYGFNFKYPKDWTIEEEPVKKHEIFLWTAEQMKEREIAIRNEEGRSFVPQVSISYFDSILVESENVGSNLGAKTLDEYVVKNTEILYEKKIDFASQDAYQAAWGGMGIAYAILAEHNKNIIELRFAADKTGSDLNTGQKKIISTFQFTK